MGWLLAPRANGRGPGIPARSERAIVRCERPRAGYPGSQRASNDMAKRKLAAIVKIQIPAGQATPAPPVGTALGPHGINIMDFCKAYNAATESQRGLVIPAEISIYEDRTFTFVTKTPPTPFLLRQAAGIEKGAENPRTDKVGQGHARRRCARSPRRRCPTSTPSTSTARCSRWPAPPARWASRGRLAHPRNPAGGRPRHRSTGPRGSFRGGDMASTARSLRRRGEASSTATRCTRPPRRSSS